MARQLVFLCASLLAFQSTYALLDIQGLLDTEAERVQSLTQKVINDAEQAVNNIQVEVDKAVQGEVQKIETLVDNFKQKVTADVDTVRVQTRADNQAATECVRAVPRQLQEVAQVILKDAIACVTNPIKEAKTIIEDLVIQIQEVNKTFVGLTSTLIGCHQKTGILQIAPCKLDALGKAGLKITSVSIRISVEIARAVALVSGLQADFTACEVAVLTKIPVKAASIIGDFTACLGKAILS